LNPTLFSIVSLIFLLTQSVILAGFARHVLRGIYPVEKETSEHIERWVWFLYPVSLILIIVTHLLIGWFLFPNLNGLPLSEWVIGPITLIITCIILYLAWRYPQPFRSVNSPAYSSFWNNILSFQWLYRLLWKLFRTLSKLFGLFSTILEGDAGILWALVLFALIFVFLQR
jgi:hypothetical protein